MSKSIAVAIIHGTGRKEPDFADDIIDVLHEKFPAHLSTEEKNEANLVIEPIYWADLTRKREDEIWERVKESGPMDNLELRRFIFNVTGDTLAYQPSEGRRELYVDVHERMAVGFKNLVEKTGPEAPLCVLAHSMGTIVAHNFLYDMQNEEEGTYDQAKQSDTPLERSETLALFVTCGSPLAIWRLRFGDAYKAIDFPGQSVEEMYPNLQPKWLNIYDKDDVLGYPISDLTEGYKELAEKGYLEDQQQNVGAFWKSWNPLSHKGYFRDKNSLEDLAGYIADVWKGAYSDSEG